MTVAWEITEHDSSAEFVGHLRLLVQGTNAQMTGWAISNMREQSEVWTRHQFTCSLSDRREARVRFRIEVSTCPEHERLGGDMPASPGHSASLPFATQTRLTPLHARTSGPAAKGQNYILAGGTGYTSCVAFGCVLLYVATDVVADRPADGRLGSYMGAHEIGHLIGLDDLYDRSQMQQCDNDRCAGNIMYHSHGTDYHSTDWNTDDPANPIPIVTVHRRPWIGHGQLREISDEALRVARGDRNARHASDRRWLARGFSRAPYQVRRYSDRRRSRGLFG